MDESNDTGNKNSFVTVVSIGNGNENEIPKNETNKPSDTDYITVLHIGENPEENEDITEEVLVYRLPGERLGFGLKFEGGTKAAEYVKRLFIQSCAPDSPASRVMSSWGNLTEGDEVLIIDSRPVNSMTRMECVKCLKDSNVIIKLLVRHLKRKVNSPEVNEDLPQVISAEKKKHLPPPPPPVPPRKVPRKLLKSKINNDHNDKKEKCENPLPPIRQRNADNNNNCNNNNNNKNMRVRSNSPEVKSRNRKHSDGSIGPPEAEYYTDLISQESLHSLSESDDTASTISTVIDRNGSLPTTPRSIQKHLDISNFPDDEEIFNTNSREFKLLNDEIMYEDETDFKKSPSGNGIIAEYKSDDSAEDLDEWKKKLTTMHDENMNIFNLPRLVDFVPKNCNENDQMKMMSLFIENERSERYDLEIIEDDYPKLSVSPQLATIGEVEEESNHSSDGSTSSFPMPIVIVHNADDIADSKDEKNGTENKVMDTLPSDPRQPPDGHEFPDFEETAFQKTIIDKFRLEHYNSDSTNNDSMSTKNTNNSSSTKKNKYSTSVSLNEDAKVLRKSQSKDEESTSEDNVSDAFHRKSSSLSDISFDKKQTEHWNNMYEQRRRTLSKLKGLVIPDSVTETDCASSTINLPEIKSHAVSLETIDSLDSTVETSSPSCAENTPSVPLIEPPWTGTSNFPKYSPAFKRKNLKLYSTGTKQEISETKNTKPFQVRTRELSTTESSSGDDSTIPLKSLNSSPTRSEVNYEYARNKPKQRTRPLGSSIESNLLKDYHKHKKEINTEDESDNDSAVSSSQSSFISRPTTSPSPTRSIEYDNVPKVCCLKPSSIEAINRRNILASAKCRSGKDLKSETPVSNEEKTDNEKKREEIIPIPKLNEKKEEILQPVVVVEKPISQLPIVARNPPQIKPPSPSQSSAIPKAKFETVAVTQKTQIPIVPSRSSKENCNNTNITPKFKEALKPTPKITKPRELKPVRISSTNKLLSVTDLRKSFEEKAQSTQADPSKLPVMKFTKPSPETHRVEERISKIPEVKPRKSLNKLIETVQIPMTPTTTTTSTPTRQVILKTAKVGDNLGIILSENEENDEITIRRIRYGSIAYQEGSLSKGDRVISINGIETRGLSQEQSMELLKTSSKSFIITVAASEETTKDENAAQKKRASLVESSPKTDSKDASGKKPNQEIILIKDGSGLGFSIEGGKDSPQGDVPLVVKKIFQGGVADKDGRLRVGDEIFAINNIDFTGFSRIQAWNMMKKIDVDEVKISLYRE